MPYVIRNKKKQYGAGGGRWGSRWVDDLQEARVFLNKGAAVASLRGTFATPKHPEKTLKVTTVRLVEEEPNGT